MTISSGLQRGHSTAHDNTVVYRLGKVLAHTEISGRWLDCGCADGGYSSEIALAGATHVVGVDIEGPRVEDARARGLDHAAWAIAPSEALPFAAGSFDGVFLNEVLEHVEDERATLRELHRVLGPNRVLVVMSPNRWFPFEGHGLTTRWFDLRFPVPFVPWLPQRLLRRNLTARNYWPSQLAAIVEECGFTVDVVDTVFAMFERWPWLPPAIARRYLKWLPRLERVWGLRKFGVSTLLVARRSSPI